MIWLQEIATENEVEMIFFPKFHCELNFIEMVWGYLKAQLRRSCTFNYVQLRDELLPQAIDSLPLAFVRKAARHCFRFMSGYRMGLRGPLLDFTMKKYKGHRMIPTLTPQAKAELENAHKMYLNRFK